MKNLMMLLVAPVLAIPAVAEELSWDNGHVGGVRHDPAIREYAVQFDEDKTGDSSGHVSQVKVFFQPWGGQPITDNNLLFYEDGGDGPGELIENIAWNNTEDDWQTLGVNVDVPSAFYISLQKRPTTYEWGVAYDNDEDTGHSWYWNSSNGWWNETRYGDLMIRCEWTADTSIEEVSWGVIKASF